MSEKKYYIEERTPCGRCKGRGITEIAGHRKPELCVLCDGYGYRAGKVEVALGTMSGWLFLVEGSDGISLSTAAAKVIEAFKSQADWAAKCRAVEDLERALRS